MIFTKGVPERMWRLGSGRYSRFLGHLEVLRCAEKHVFTVLYQLWGLQKSLISLSFSFLVKWGQSDTHLKTSLEVWWLRLRTSNAGGMSSIPGQGTKIPYAT